MGVRSADHCPAPHAAMLIAEAVARSAMDCGVCVATKMAGQEMAGVDESARRAAETEVPRLRRL